MTMIEEMFRIDEEARQDFLELRKNYWNAGYDVTFEDIEIIDKLLESKKLTDRQKEAIRSLLKYYYSTD